MRGGQDEMMLMTMTVRVVELALLGSISWRKLIKHAVLRCDTIMFLLLLLLVGSIGVGLRGR